MPSLLQAARQNRWDLVLRNLMLEAPPAAAITHERDYITGQTVVHLAASAERIDVLRRMKQLGVRIRDTVNFGNRNPLEEAQIARASKAVQWLLQNEYSISEQLYYSGNFTFHSLARLFARDAEEINTPICAYSKRSCAAICVEELRFPELVWLAIHGANLAAVDQAGNTLLHLVAIPASSNSSSHGVDTENGVDEDTNDSVVGSPNIESPVESSYEWHQFEQQYHSHLTQTDSVLQCCEIFLSDELRAAELAALRIIAFLCNSGFDVNAVNQDYATPALSIAERSAINPYLAWKALQILRTHGANLCIQDSEGLDVSMRFALECGVGPWLHWLLTKGGCRPNVIDRKGRTFEDYVVGNGMQSLLTEASACCYLTS